MSFIFCFGVLGIYNVTLDLDPGESVGEGWYLLQSYEVDYEIIDGEEEVVRSSTQVGPGVLNISVVVSIGVSLLYVFISKGRNMRKQKEKSKDGGSP